MMEKRMAAPLKVDEIPVPRAGSIANLFPNHTSREFAGAARVGAPGAAGSAGGPVLAAVIHWATGEALRRAGRPASRTLSGRRGGGIIRDSIPGLIGGWGKDHRAVAGAPPATVEGPIV